MYSLLQIAPTLAEFFGIHIDSHIEPVEQILRVMHARNPSVVVLVVIDSLDFQFYSDFASELSELHELVKDDGLLFECDTVSTHTTPAIASILTGLEPELHRIRTSEDVGKSNINSILEILDDTGMQTAAILETNGTKPLLGRISHVFAVDDRGDIVEYDALIKTHTISVLKKEEVRFVFSHLRVIDRYAHRNWDLSVAARITNENMKEIVKAVGERNGMLFICGDHETHLKGRRMSEGKKTVPLIVY
ncbi:MAG: sulfatase-like hydrolase/transferase [Candidatus Methanospirareceae archaeon]